MALDTRIALGVQPVQQQPNMLAQYAQVMGIKAAQQEMQGNDAVRQAYAQGGDLGDPDFRRKIMAANPQLGSKLVNQFSEMSARDVKTQADSLKTIRDSIGVVNSPAEMAQFLKGAYSTPGGALLTKLAPYETAVANIPQDPKSFEEYKRKFSSSADRLFESADARLSAQVSREGHGVQMRGQNLTAQTAANNLEFQKQKGKTIAGEGQFFREDAYGNLYPVQGFGAQFGPDAPAPAMPPAAANAFVTTRPSVNALAPTAPPQVVPGSPTVANAAAIAAQNNVPRPKQPLRQPSLVRVNDPATPGQKLEVDANVYKQGTTLGAPGVIGVASTETLNPAQKQKIKTEMGKDYKILSETTAQTDDLLKSIDMLRDPKIADGLKAITGYSGVYTPTFKDASQLAQTRLDNLKGKVIALGKASAAMSGAIGSIANQEWKILADQIAAIDPKMGDKALLEQVQLVEDRALGVVERAKEQYARQYGEHFENLGPQYSEAPKLKPRGTTSSGIDNNNPLLK